jgi:hypothetical protein
VDVSFFVLEEILVLFSVLPDFFSFFFTLVSRRAGLNCDPLGWAGATWSL